MTEATLTQGREDRPERPQRVLHVPAGQGPTVWVDGDTYTVKASHENTGGSLAFLEASVPPGCGPAAHVHNLEDEAYYLLSGELEVLDAGRTFTAHQGDFVFIPRGVTHRFKNTGLHVAKMVFLFTPAGFDKFFLEAGDPARPGEHPQPWPPERFPHVAEIGSRYGWELGEEPAG
ncbi:cupin domain-containing protein [Streptomyces piniterrae]|uniref:Cupin domain-containing protein n=1 Tax=Streptomyces piniterrae TaxID=2571125 RepID=A0A4V5MMD6_9ACTN|nr:cupin domain-containing protein [Streptomyces piniterrae]TJZ57108.1 cupin domain-containing protein [Streptomyces piniterrae]